ncbi:MAG: hypothetical protein M3Y12_01150 [Bacteroidota bacterium]|nr:hypothetical protein [Bacteroidota bacterium]
MRYLFPLFLVLSCLLTILPGCEPKEDLVQTTGRLTFDQDTVLFDTVFTTIRTVTKRLWVYNRNSGAVKTDISLAGTVGNTYSLVINGDAGTAKSDVLIRGNDSLQILVRAVLGDNGQATAPKQFVVTDQINFRTNGNEQNVKLVAYGQNAYFHRGDDIKQNTTWATDKPHVIIPTSRVLVPGQPAQVFGVLVRPDVTLTIPKGARIYCHAGAYLQVEGTLRVNDDFVAGAGATDTVKATNPNIVRFQGDRLEADYLDTPGQWGGIVFTATSRKNSIRYAEIKNATFGALLLNPDNLTHPDLTLANTVIRNISGSNLSFANTTASAGGGVISYSGDLTATNCLFTNCGEYAVVGVGGGVYNFNFCTFANYTPAFRRETASLSFTNEKATDAKIRLPLTLNLHNSIVWGSNLGPNTIDDELYLKNYTEYASTISIRNSLLRTKAYATTPEIVRAPGVNLLNVDPLFTRTALFSSRPDYTLQATSPAITPRRQPAVTVLLPLPRFDLRNLPLQALPALGAYEHK